LEKNIGIWKYWNNEVFQFVFGGTRFVASGHDGAWPSRADIPHHSNIPVKLLTSAPQAELEYTKALFLTEPQMNTD
jgi:hypothetical protein